MTSEHVQTRQVLPLRHGERLIPTVGPTVQPVSFDPELSDFRHLPLMTL